jgi:TatD DNase family protein
MERQRPDASIDISNDAGVKAGRFPLVDTHAHLDFGDFDADLDAVLARALDAGVIATITIGIEPGDWPKTQAIASHHDEVYAAYGIHPNSADQTNTHTLGELHAFCRGDGKQGAVAIGETGLDFYRRYVPHDVQRESFRAHLDLARHLDLPMIVHNRDAHAEVLEVLRRDGSGTRGVMHSFSGDLEFSMECVRLGYLISLAGPVTFRKAADKHLIAKTLPLEFLLLETDCPFLTPEPFRGRRNEPSYVRYTAQAIATIRGISFEEVAKATTANAASLFDLTELLVASASH